MKTAWLICPVVMLVAGLAPGQDPPQSAPAGAAIERPLRSARLRFEPMARRLAEELDLSQTQREQFDAILAKYRLRAEQQQSEHQQVRELARQYREARQSGDQERAEQINAQMRELAASGARVVDEFMEEVKGILDESQVRKLEEFRQRNPQPPMPARPWSDADDLIRRLPTELDLTEQQQAKLNELLAERDRRAEQRRQQWRELRPLMQELREARAAGDEQRVAELEAELEQKRPRPAEPLELLDQLEPVLNADQKAKLAELRLQLGPPEEGPDDLRTIFRAARELDLTPSQRERLQLIMRDARRAERRSLPDSATRAEQARLVKIRIKELLTAEQAEEFDRLLEQSRPPGPPERHRFREGPRTGGGEAADGR